MKHFMESITYIVTSIAVLSLLKTLHLYWYAMPMGEYIASIIVGISLVGIYIKNISQKDKDWMMKIMLVLSVLIIVATILFTVPKEILFSVIVATVAGLATYYNYYRMAEYVLFNRAQSGRMKIRSPEEFYLSPRFQINIEEYLNNSNKKLFETLRKIKDAMNNGELSVYRDGDDTYIRRWRV